MAHFAEIGLDNIVLRVIVVNNDVCLDSNGDEQESIGIAFCQSLFGGTWKQTSYNGNIRKNFAGINYTYDSSRDAFIPPQEYPSWTLDEDTCLWNPPVTYPSDGKKYKWHETSRSWIEIT